MSLMATALVLAWVAIVLLTLAVAGLMRQVHLLLTERAVDGEPTVRPAQVPAELDLGGGEGLVVFASTSCVACSEIMPVLAGYARVGRPCVVVTAAARDAAWPDELTYRERAADLFERFAVVATPYAMRVSDGVVVDAAPVGSPAALRRLAGDDTRDHADAAV